MNKGKQQLSTPLIMGLALLSATAALSTDMYLPALPGITADLNTTAPLSQLTLSAFMVGMAIGQLIIGPISDQLGRKKLLVGGAIASLLASVVCAIAPSISILILARLVQGMGGGACIVISRAIVPDLAKGKDAAQAFALLMIIQGIAPVLAPLVGGVLTGPFGWRSVFWVLAAVNVVQFLVIVLGIRESKPVEERSAAGLRGMVDNYKFVLRNGQFVAYSFTLSFAFGAMFSYISASPFVMQNQMGMSVLAYSLVFGINSLGLMLGGLVNKRLLKTNHPHKILATVLKIFIVLSVVLLIQVLFIHSDLMFLVILFLIVAQIPMIMANTTALGTEVVRMRAGSGSAILGFFQFSMAGLVSPLMGLGEDKMLTMAVSMSVCAVIAGLMAWLAGHKGLPVMS